MSHEVHMLIITHDIYTFSFWAFMFHPFFMYSVFIFTLFFFFQIIYFHRLLLQNVLFSCVKLYDSFIYTCAFTQLFPQVYFTLYDLFPFLFKIWFIHFHTFPPLLFPLYFSKKIIFVSFYMIHFHVWFYTSFQFSCVILHYSYIYMHDFTRFINFHVWFYTTC